MGKFLIWVVVGVAVWFGWRLFVISKRRSERATVTPEVDTPAGERAQQDPSSEAQRMGGPERMVQCAVCGLHLPASEGRFAGGKVYCSDAHRDQAAGGDSDQVRPASDKSSDHR